MRAGSPRFPAVRAALAAALLAAAPACSSCPAAAVALVAHPDYSTPAAAGASFFAALGCDEAQAEYRAFGERLKQEYGADLAAWLLARPAVREELGPAVAHAHRLRAAREELREDGVLVWWEAAGAERVGLLMQRQNYLEIRTDDGRELGFQLARPPGDWMRLEGRRLLMEVAAEDSILRGLDPARVTQVTLGSEWKIADWTLPEEGQTPASFL